MFEEDVYVQVLHDYTYEYEKGKQINIKKGEELLVVHKSNHNWWQVIRDSENQPFYAPSCYLDVIYNPLIHKSFNVKDENANVESKYNQNNCVDQDIIQQEQSLEDHAQSNSLSISHHECESQSRGFTLTFENPLYSIENEIYCNQNGSVENTSSSSFRTDPATKRTKKIGEIKRQNISLSQDNLPIYANLPLATNIAPPIPRPGEIAHRSLPNSWLEYIDENGRKYYYHSPSNKVTWKPPRRSESLSNSFEVTVENTTNSEATSPVPKPPPKQLKPKLKKLTHSSTESLDSSNSPCMFTILPPGWTQECDKSGIVYYFNRASEKKWYSSQDENGRTYFYDEDSSESLWELPDLTNSEDQKYNRSGEPGFEIATDVTSLAAAISSKFESCSPSEVSPRMRSKKAPKLPVPRQFKVRSMVAPESVNVSNVDDEKNLSSCTLGCPVYSGVLNKTKLVEGGRRVRKNWTSCYVILTDVYLLFYKDTRSAAMVPNTKPEFVIDLNGALVDWCPEKSSRKNVFQISTITGHQLLLQHEDSKEIKDWFGIIQDAIIKLPSSLENFGTKAEDHDNSIQEAKLLRSKSTKQCHCRKGSNEDFTEVIPSDKKRKIRDKLRQFFVRRPTMESLREKGIILDEPVFGCLLETLCQKDQQPIPNFVMRCIETIEKKELTADGIYRASGNLSQVQKIRFHVNQDDYKCLDDEDDVHVLTGALKMFFREMKEPLFPFQYFNMFLNAIGLLDSQSKLKALKDLVHNMPEPNYETLKFLLQHLLRVTEFHKQNRMQVQNLAIVFGPTLMWPEVESTNIALDMMHQNRIIEFLLLEYYAVFE